LPSESGLRLGGENEWGLQSASDSNTPPLSDFMHHLVTTLAKAVQTLSEREGKRANAV